MILPVILLTALSVIPLGEIDEHRDDRKILTTEGTVIDIVPDEIDYRYSVLLLKDGAAILPVSIDASCDRSRLLDARIRVTGKYYRHVHGYRTFADPCITTTTNALTVLVPPPEDRLDAPPLRSLDQATPQDVKRLGKQSFTGRVLALWGRGNVMLGNGTRIITATLGRDAPLPSYGLTVKMAGYPETDLYSVNLSKAIWREVPADPSEEPEPQDMSAEEILNKRKDFRLINNRLHGQLIRLRGRVLDRAGSASSGPRLELLSDGHRTAVDCTAVPAAANNVTVGCEIEVTGRCLMESETWTPYNIFPQIRGFSVIVRKPDDIRVMSRPPWWTPGRLLAVILALFAVLIAFFVWNRILNRLVERRGRALFRAEIASAAAELRTDERTRLAVELHDTISQNLTGALMRTDAALGLLDTDRGKAARNLEIASRTLASCRDDVRACIWDLKSQALEEKDLNVAIRRTLKPHAEDATLAIRFSVPRAKLTDKTAHAILRIIRELTVNAIRHGQAKTIRIAGAGEDGRILFSVTDDGSGFDPETRPGIAEGHFGLEGVAERIRDFDGKMSIESAPGKGTKVTICLKSRC